MKRFFVTMARLPLLIAVLLLAAAVLLACGPAAQSAPEVQPGPQPASQESDPTPTPTAEPTPAEESGPKYPNLDTFLQALVKRYEDGELTESETAAQAHTYHGSSVLATIDLSANIDAVGAWMEGRGISSRHTNATHIPPNIHAFVKVSLLGALSQQEGIIQVKEAIPPWAELPSGQDPGGASGAGGASGGTGAEGPSGDAPGPRLPLWLKGHPYHKLGRGLDDLVDRYERGELTEAEAAAQTDFHQGSTVAVEVELINDPANTDAVAAWLKSKGVMPIRVIRHDVYTNIIVADVPVSLLADLSKQSGLIGVNIGVPGHTGPTGGPLLTENPGQRYNAPPAPPPPTPTPTPVVSQGGWPLMAPRLGILSATVAAASRSG